MPPRQRFVHRCDNLLVRQNLIGVLHPVFAQIAHLLGDQSVTEAELRSSHLNHVAASRAVDAAPDAAAHD
jgi:hypothetical protein